ncbi:alpha/beta hydrolase [Sphingosinicellaceae bacterium]|nr:alpha/beta hydrolase [Sphingosinicellaceae bacterium]
MTQLYFIHGMWSTPAVWDGLREHFLRLGIASHAPALPHHDRRRDEPPPPELAALGLQDYIDYLVADVSRLPEPPVIVGHSLGGFLAQAVASRVQPAGLVCLSPAASTKTTALSTDAVRSVWPIVSRWGWWKHATMIDPATARWGIFNNVPGPVAEAEIDALVWDSGRVLADLGFPWATRNGAAAVDYSQLTMPALVVIGCEDRITPPAVARATARHLSGTVDYHELPGIGHWLFHTPVVERVAALIEAWLPE